MGETEIAASSAISGLLAMTYSNRSFAFDQDDEEKIKNQIAKCKIEEALSTLLRTGCAGMTRSCVSLSFRQRLNEKKTPK